MLSVVIPAFNEQEMVPAAAGQIDGILSRAGIPHELIFIDDGSRDATWAEIRAESEHRDTVRGVHFSRNFRKEAAIFAGLQAADGDCVAVIDCDLQHPPEKLVEMYRLWEQGVEVVEGVKTDRGEESLAHRVAAKTFYRLISEATHIDMTRASDFKLLDRKAVNVLLSMREKRAFFRALSSWIGFRTAEVPYEVRERAAGESKWSTWLLIKYALSNITAFTSLPLHLITGLRRGVVPGCAYRRHRVDRASGHGPCRHRPDGSRDPAAVPQRPDHGRPRHHRLLSRQYLYGNSGPPALHRVRDVRRAEKNLKAC